MCWLDLSSNDPTRRLAFVIAESRAEWEFVGIIKLRAIRVAIKKSDLYASIWASCDELRGGMDASQYKDYVLFMLFIKYVSDKYADYAGFEPPIVIPKGASFKDMAALKGDSDIGNKINTQVIHPLIDANTRLARSDFPDFNDPNKLGDGQARVERLSNLIAIFENPALDFAQNRAEHDDVLGDAYEYLMRHFATQSGKSKGQFYTPAEVSRVIAKVLGISPQNTVASTTAYDPTCGSGSLLLKVAAEAGKHITLEGQEKDSTTAGLARMNMILHDFPTANILSGGEGTLVKPRFLDGEQLRTYDYVVANPPFSDKTWSTGLALGEGGSGDKYQRFTWGVPPKKQGDYAYLLHIIRSMKSRGKAACILPHGVLFRGSAEAVIRQQLVRSGILKGIIGLPANLFYGTGIPACIVVLDKENTAARKGIFMIDASKRFRKDGPKNRLREQDIHKIVDTFRRQDESNPRYARMVPVEEIADPKNDYNLNLPRYIDSTEPEDLQDIEGHLRGGIPERDLDALGGYWKIMPALRAALFESLRPGYFQLKLSLVDVKPAILGHAQFAAFNDSVTKRFEKWKQANTPHLEGFVKDGHPKVLIETISESLLADFRAAPLLDAYDIYQHLMDYWAETMQDDVYLVSAVGWKEGAKPREIRQVKNKDGKPTWPAKEDFRRRKRRFKSDLVPAALLINRFFAAGRDAIAALECELAAVEQQLDEKREEEGGEDGLLAEANEANEAEQPKITGKSIKAALRRIGDDPDETDARQALEEYRDLLDRQAQTKGRLKAEQELLESKLDAKYVNLTEDEIKTLVVDDKWLATLADVARGELERVSQTLTGRIRQLAERYATPLPKLTDGVAALAARVEGHLKEMGAVWK
jgi:type I restriction enzyme M protein